MKPGVEIAERRAEVAGLEVLRREAGDAPILYLHGVPTASWDWEPFLERAGGIAPDLPGFGASAKPGDFNYSIPGYADFLEALCADAGHERLSLVMHDWGAVGLALAQRRPELVERIVLIGCVPFLPGYRWHRVARAWRTPVVGELTMGFTTRLGFRRSLPRQIADRAYDDFDHGTQRAILRLYRSAPPEVLAAHGEGLGEVGCPALVAWPTRDPYIGADFGRRYADALGGAVELEEIDAGHWPWLERPELVDRVAAFVG
jgi:pimeloyl-ACP methyl ester carboxylesterase